MKVPGAIRQYDLIYEFNPLISSSQYHKAFHIYTATSSQLNEHYYNYCKFKGKHTASIAVMLEIDRFSQITD